MRSRPAEKHTLRAHGHAPSACVRACVRACKEHRKHRRRNGNLSPTPAAFSTAQRTPTVNSVQQASAVLLPGPPAPRPRSPEHASPHLSLPHSAVPVGTDAENTPHGRRCGGKAFLTATSTSRPCRSTPPVRRAPRPRDAGGLYASTPLSRGQNNTYAHTHGVPQPKPFCHRCSLCPA
jgi:hypothetical protein